MRRTFGRMTVAGLGVLLGALTSTATASASDSLQDATRAAALSAGYQDGFVASAGPAAQRVHTEYGVPASVTVAQSILESDWGRSQLATKDRNFFGFKCVDPVSPGPVAAGCAAYPTQECVPEPCHQIDAFFRSYASMDSSFRDYGRLLTSNTVYSAALPLKQDPKAFITEIGKRYATDPAYSGKVITLMERYNLYRFDT